MSELPLHEMLSAVGDDVAVGAAPTASILRRGRRAVRRRRACAAAGTTSLATVVALGAVTVARRGGGDGPASHLQPANPSAAASTWAPEPSATSGGSATLDPRYTKDWPVLGSPGKGQGAAVDCAVGYPQDLSKMTYAFDADVTRIDVGAYDEDAAARPVVVTVAIHRMFRGSLPTVTRMKTWDFMLPDDPQSVVGIRALFSAGPSLDVMACGFTRPYNDSDAALWDRTFSSS
jgi:hypothetical protein